MKYKTYVKYETCFSFDLYFDPVIKELNLQNHLSYAIENLEAKFLYFLNTWAEYFILE